MDHVPERFNICDIKVGRRRHLIFYSDRQFELLRASRKWFVDATFKVVRKPFTQLFSIHTFVQSDGEKDIKQVPLVFALMSGQRAKDYAAILKSLINEL